MAEQEYLILIVEKPWNPHEYADQDFETEMVRHRAFAEAVKAAGQRIVASDALDGPETATRIDPATDAAPAVFTDAPFGEVKELVSGYYQITAESKEQALELAALCPTSGHLDVFPIFDMSKF